MSTSLESVLRMMVWERFRPETALRGGTAAGCFTSSPPVDILHGAREEEGESDGRNAIMSKRVKLVQSSNSQTNTFSSNLHALKIARPRRFHIII